MILNNNPENYEKELELLGGTSIAKLWENASPTSSFALQTLDIDWQSYDRIGVEYRYSTTDATSSYVEIKSGVMAQLLYVYTRSTGAPYVGERTIGFLTDGIKINTAYHGASTNSAEQTGSFCIPTRIYGIKGVQ